MRRLFRTARRSRVVLLRRKEAPGIACGESITQETGWHGHHVTPKVLGWPDGAANRQHIAVKLYADYSWRGSNGDDVAMGRRPTLRPTAWLR